MLTSNPGRTAANRLYPRMGSSYEGRRCIDLVLGYYIAQCVNGCSLLSKLSIPILLTSRYITLVLITSQITLHLCVLTCTE